MQVKNTKTADTAMLRLTQLLVIATETRNTTDDVRVLASNLQARVGRLSGTVLTAAGDLQAVGDHMDGGRNANATAALVGALDAVVRRVCNELQEATVLACRIERASREAVVKTAAG